MHVSRRDFMTGKLNTLDLDITQDQIDAWQGGQLIQNVMPHLSADEREFLINGTMPGEFDKLFSEE